MTTPSLPHTDYTRFESMREYEDCLDALIPRTERVIRIFEKALGAAYNSAARCERLRAFFRNSPLNRMFIVVHEPDSIDHRPRLARLLQQFSHLVQVRRTPHWVRHVYDPFVIFDASHYLHRFHYAHMRAARGLDDPDGAQQLLERFGELWDASTPTRITGVTGL